jgi:DNA-binding beta-propeller fold protein YncE
LGVDTGSLQIVRRVDVGARPHNLEVTADGLLVIATQGTDAVSVIDPTTDPATVKRIPIGMPPHDVAVGADGRTVFVVSERGLLARLDPGSGRVLQRIALRGRPHNVAPWRQAAWITDVSARRVFVVDSEQAQELPISIEGHDLAVRPGSGKLWVTPWSSDRTVVIDLGAQTEIAELRVGRKPSHKQLAFTADGSEAWVTEPESGSLFVVDAQTRRVRERVDLGGHPHHLRFAAGRAYVVVAPGDLVVLDVGTRGVINRVTVGSQVHDVALRASR